MAPLEGSPTCPCCCFSQRAVTPSSVLVFKGRNSFLFPTVCISGARKEGEGEVVVIACVGERGLQLRLPLLTRFFSVAIYAAP